VKIRNRLLLCVSVFLYYSGLMHVIHWLHRRSGQRLLVVNYHQASGGELRHHLLYLRKHFRLQFLDHALETLYTADKKKAPGKDRRLPMAITFDDGYVDNYTHAYALARELQIPITIFLISGYIEKGAAFWWFDHMVEKASVDQITIDGRTYHSNRLDEQQELAQVIDLHVSAAADREAQQTYLRQMSNMLSVPVNADLNEVPVPMLNWEQVLAMQASGWVDFGGHTLHHPILGILTRAEEAFKEVATCRSHLQEKLGRSLRVFAYPHGGMEHIGTNGLLAAQRAGYRWAVTTLQGVNTPKTHPYLIRRISANSQLHWLLIVLMTSGVWDVLSYFNWLLKRMKYRKIQNVACLLSMILLLIALSLIELIM
jgi:peptidoglycan/xylan/chitin deacetylase (PgdA/CDA1 family)